MKEVKLVLFKFTKYLVIIGFFLTFGSFIIAGNYEIAFTAIFVTGTIILTISQGVLSYSPSIKNDSLQDEFTNSGKSLFTSSIWLLISGIFVFLYLGVILFSQLQPVVLESIKIIVLLLYSISYLFFAESFVKGIKKVEDIL